MTNRYLKIRHHTVDLCRPLQTEDYVIQPAVDISPPKWHLAHTSWFFEEMILVECLKNYRRFHPEYAYLFNSYYESIGKRVLRSNRGNLSRPTLTEIFEYREYVDRHMLDFLEHKIDKKVLGLIELGLQHEQQHQELLLTDIKYILGHNPLFPAYDRNFQETILGHQKVENRHFYIKKEDAICRIGTSSDTFHFDNEFPIHQVFIKQFEIENRLVENGEYLEFMEDGGYERPEFWFSEGLDWARRENIKNPLYWHKQDGQWYRYALSGMEKLNLEEPVTHVSHYEAAAYAEWKGMRLPTEFEWESASGDFAWGLRWEHTGSAYLPYPGFLKKEGAVGEYNGKFMINQMVLRGASVATPSGHSRYTYRNFFHPHLQWQFSGIRLAKKIIS